ncbi:MAG: folate family ECF transporter S component [Oscillospiraceae bacterium]
MKKQENIILSSIKELKNLKSLIVLSLLIALNISLGIFTIPLPFGATVGISFVAIASAGYLFGPVCAGTAAALCDIIKYILHPTGPFNPGFTICAIIGGFIYGIFLYKKNVTIKNCIFAKVFIALIVNITLNTLFISLTYGKSFWGILPLRIVKNITCIPVETVILYHFLRFVIEPIKDMAFSKGANIKPIAK